MRLLMTAMTSLLLISTLTGCVETTQQKSARVGLVDDRLLASQEAVLVTHGDPRVSVLGVTSVTRGRATAIAVQLRNVTTRPVSDLPISVGVRTRGGRTSYLNRAAGLPYFQTHVGAISAAGTVTWVYTGRGLATTGARPFARVGVPTVDDQAGTTGVPTITAVAVASPTRPGVARAVVTNRSSVPQVGLALYASATSGRRLLAAGQASVAQLAAGHSATVAIPVIGAAGAGTFAVDAPATNLR